MSRSLTTLALVLLLGPQAGAKRAAPIAAGPRYVHHWTVTQRLESTPILGFARLDDRARRVIQKLIRSSSISTEVRASGGRVLLSLDRRHPAGPAELLLCEDLDQLVVLRPDRRQTHTLPLGRLPDVLDLHESSTRADFDIDDKQTGQEAAEAPTAPRIEHRWPWRTRTHDDTILYRYTPQPGRATSWPIRQPFTVTYLDQPRPFYAIFDQPLLHVALPLLQTPRGVLLLESLAWRTGTPLAWTTTVRNEGKPGGVPPTFHATVDDHGWVRGAPDQLVANRAGYHTVRALTGAGEGLQIVPPPSLAGLRQRPSTGKLSIENRARRAAWIYVDGFLVGWVGPRRQLAVQGLPDGHYRIYAVSPTGVRSWGPMDVYVPGPLTLR